ncbi:MAG TPA: PKD domain-containing protein [Vicinamibacteria bacterium]|nr:PKD domain-containing protein [Vicinamibacteria bacterium]
MKTFSLVRRVFPLVLAGLLAGACNTVQSTSEPSAVVLDQDGTYAADGKPVNPATISFRAKCNGLTCTFTDTSKCSAPLRVWSFGDGSPSETTAAGGTIQHTYAEAGTYGVTVSAVSCYAATKYIRVD